MQQGKAAQLICVTDRLAKSWRDGRIKLYLIWKALNYRRRHGKLFSQGDFSLGTASGIRQENVSVYCRRKEGEWLLVAFPKWLASAGAVENSPSQPQFWGDTHLLLPATAPPCGRTSSLAKSCQQASPQRATVLTSSRAVPILSCSDARSGQSFSKPSE